MSATAAASYAENTHTVKVLDSTEINLLSGAKIYIYCRSIAGGITTKSSYRGCLDDIETLRPFRHILHQAQVWSGAHLYSEDIFCNHVAIHSTKVHLLVSLSVVCPAFPTKKKKKSGNSVVKSFRNEAGIGG